MKIITKDNKSIELKKSGMQLPEGQYHAEIINVELVEHAYTKYGTCDRVDITYEVELDGHKMNKTQGIFYNPNDNSDWMRFIDSLYGDETPEGAEIGQWIGVSGVITIEHITTDKGLYDKVIDWQWDDVEEDSDFAVEFDEE